jgi:2-polyprenyl-3-methyl-5-hydroxy-6-metoxy-1,4-benzoquinol methylase/glycosyltransferase involved in cell wall biosynthesis
MDTQTLCVTSGSPIWRCRKCSTDFVWPMPSDQALRQLYDGEAWFEGNQPGGYAAYDQQTEPSLPMVTTLLARLGAGGGRSVMDVGCGYGTHLRLAADLGWKCFGVEPSLHARKMAQERHRGNISIVERVEDLIPHRFELVLMLDVLEHVKDPYALFYSLFSKDVIGPETLVVIATPNARSNDAVRDPAGWLYRHPPSHLTYFSGKSLHVFLERLKFQDIHLEGTSPVPYTQLASFQDEESDLNISLSGHAGLLCEARGSDFIEFMHERYVPGTWSKLAEYEHMPRYRFACGLAAGAKVLDFGCGTGYGSAALAKVAVSVTGLDIDHDALAWARSVHRRPGLEFEQRVDLGAGMRAGAFDLITCFEMIEHVDYPTQQSVIANIARLLNPAGILVISTPNPDVTANYGDNPYHIREMSEAQFLELLTPAFPHVVMLRQWVRPSVLISESAIPGDSKTGFSGRTEVSADPPLAYIALCSAAPIPQPSTLCDFDNSVDYIRDALDTERRLNNLRFERYTLNEAITERDRSIVEHNEKIATLRKEIDKRDQSVVEHNEGITTLRGEVSALHQQLSDRMVERDRSIVEHNEGITTLRGEVSALHRQLSEQMVERDRSIVEHNEGITTLRGEVSALHRQLSEQMVERDRSIVEHNERITTLRGEISALHQQLSVIRQSRTFQFVQLLRNEPWSFSKLARLASLVGRAACPERIKTTVRPLLNWLRAVVQRSSRQKINSNAYHVRTPAEVSFSRPRVTHAIANFHTGGSSRLVVDLLEHLGHKYDQEVITSSIGNPPSYTGLQIQEFNFSATSDRITAHLFEFAPEFVHMHYWGDVDARWYQTFMQAAELYGCPVIENVNTPVVPYRSAAIRKYVYVSDYVREHFGESNPSEMVIYPGSDFSHFNRRSDKKCAEDCIGMVYRLEPDKLNLQAIDPLILAAQLRPETRVLIIGGGSLLESFMEAVKKSGVEKQFEFTGYVPYESLPLYYERMAVFVAPVWKESFGQVTPFAMNMGLPVAGYRIGALPEILGNTELLATPGDSHALAGILIALLNDRERSQRIGSVNRERAQGLFSVDAMVASYDALYADHVAEPK